ncbi:hypothetical protein WJX72_000237 [[Myrmecia] bisecta]|uniref:threonine--tRNA ligase n=1 Tax=[Myrmecia] bisecta TaxID=41462 RepID=A0AAW1Q9P1_9CHLO
MPCPCSGVQPGRLFVAARRGQAAQAVDTPAAPAEAIALPTSDESEELLRIRHSCAHIMAMAVQRLHPDVRVTVGPWIERGFYYDFDTPKGLKEEDLKAIKKEMQAIIRRDLPLTCEELSVEEARRRIEEIQEPYKLEILDSILARDPSATITVYHIGDPGKPDHWWDLCAGPHVASTGKINPAAFNLERLSGAYWRGDETKAMLTRIYGTAWQTKEQLKAYERFLAEAKRRDHRKLGQELDLFSLNEGAGGGLVLWHPKGAMVRHIIETYWKELHLQHGYQLLYTPHIAASDLWKTSGHLDFYRENMFNGIEVEDEEWLVKPMNCPYHVSVYNTSSHSHRDLPVRFAELGTVYRYERSGTLHGLFRVRGFTQDDAHIFCLPTQIAGEIRGVLDLVQEVMGAFGFSRYEINLSTRPEKSVGTDEIWQLAEESLGQALQAKGWAYQVDAGGGAFYGPKIDIKVEDAIGRRWQCSTIQLDFNLPQRFGMTYVDAQNTKQQPIMIHRAIFGSIERFFGILVENYAGAFPLWLAPVQCRILPVADTFVDYAERVAAQMRGAGVRAEVISGERIAKLIRNAEKAKIPVMCVVGNNEVEANTLAVRTYSGGDQGSLAVPDVVARIQEAGRMRIPF